MLPNSPAPVAEKRRARRVRRLRQALCVFNNGTSTLDVTLRNVTPLGARLLGDGLYRLPKTFELRIRESDGGYEARKARLVWSAAETAGIEFIH